MVKRQEIGALEKRMVSFQAVQKVRAGALGLVAIGFLSGASLPPQASVTDVSGGDANATMSPEEREGIIFERQQTMTQLQRDGEVLGKIVAGIQPPDKLGEVTRAIANGAKDSLENYRMKVPGGRSKPEVWTNNADFTERMEAFVRNADAMAKAGETGNVTSVTGLMIDGMPCKQCHDIYREPKRP